MYKKSVKVPGQRETCELCDKVFTVTPYSRTGPDGGLLCAPCGKAQDGDLKKEGKAKKKPAVTGKKRRKIESNKMDRKAILGTKTLQQICIEKVAHHHTDVDDLGDLPQKMVQRLSEIFSKNRVMNPRTLDLFLRPDRDEVVITDAASESSVRLAYYLG